MRLERSRANDENFSLANPAIFATKGMKRHSYFWVRLYDLKLPFAPLEQKCGYYGQQ